MRRSFVIALNDLRVFLKNKAAYFWLFGSPLLFAFFIGMAARGPGDPSNPRPAIAIENADTGFMGGVFVEELGGQGLNVIKSTEKAQRGVRIPATFTDDILARKPVKVEFFSVSGSGTDAADLMELRVVRAVVALNGHLIEQSADGQAPTEERLREVLRRANPVGLKASFATRRPVPTGYRQSVPGALVMFTMMNLLIFGGVSVASERREGVLRRLLAQPVSFANLVSGKIVGLIFLGAVQTTFLLIASTFFANLSLTAILGPLLLLLAVYTWAAAALGVLIGSIVSREDKVVAICVLAAMVMAALGGCWWPLEVVPEHVRAAGHLFPTSWAMDGLHQLISFGGSWSEVFKPIAVLGVFAVAATAAAVRWFRA